MEVSSERKFNPDDLIFSLDIGTRTVIGIVGIYEDETFKILASCIKNHDRRNMYDGQIHDIDGVTKVVREVKETLEEKLGTKLKKVSIAAAGRSLKTSKVRLDREIDSTIEISQNMVESLELEAVQKAQEMVDKHRNEGDLRYYCIGYSVISYYLDDSFIEKLNGHRGEKIGLDLLATFLPQVVIDSLYTVVSRANLEVNNITLEPIAAINVAINENLRLLNLALVDVGAGTSDIAITKGGSIIAYGMTSTAGDEITEKIAQTYLLDFNSSEKLKVTLNKEKNHQFSDIVDVKYNLSTEEIISNVQDVIDKLAKEICEKILEYNEKSPSAVFLVGGSSQIPTLREVLAKYLNIPIERVAIRDASTIENVEGIEEGMKGPDIVTPIGIAMEGVHNKYKNFIGVSFNEEKIRIFNTDNVKVSDLLILAGYNPRKLIPERGVDFSYFINGERRIAKGEVGEPAQIFVNSILSNLYTKLNNGDSIKIINATKGRKKILHLYDCIPKRKVVSLNKEDIGLIINLKVNGVNVEENILINDDDTIEYTEIKSIKELLKYKGLSICDNEIYRNGEKASLHDFLSNGDIIITGSKYNTEKTIVLNINGEEKVFSYSKEDFVFVDIFNYIDFDLNKLKGKLVLNVNGNNAQYMQKLENNDKIEIYWED